MSLKILSAFCLLVSFVFAGQSGFSQNKSKDVVMLLGKVAVDGTETPIANATVTVRDDQGNFLQKVYTKDDGRFEIYMNYDEVRFFEFGAKGFVSKIITIDSKNVPAADQIGGYGFDVDVNLFKWKKGCDYSIFADPIGKAQWSAAEKELRFDQEYTRKFQDKAKEAKLCSESN